MSPPEAANCAQPRSDPDTARSTRREPLGTGSCPNLFLPHLPAMRSFFAPTLRAECSESAPTQSPNPPVDAVVPVPRYYESPRFSRPMSDRPSDFSRPTLPLELHSQPREALPRLRPALQSARGP